MRRTQESELDFSPRDAFFNEILASRARLPAPTIEVPLEGGDVCVPVHAMEVHPQFVHAVTAEDVAALLQRMPAEYLRELPRIVLLAGTNRQAAARFDEGVFGHYDGSGIYLHAYPKRHFEVDWRWSVRSTDLEEFLRWGAVHEDTTVGSRLRFSPASLRDFYLYDVLLHEIGHHVDRRRQQDDAAERFAHWFADEQVKALGVGNQAGC